MADQPPPVPPPPDDGRTERPPAPPAPAPFAPAPFASAPFAPPGRVPSAAPGPAPASAVPPGAAPPPAGAPAGYYPQQAYYAPGWSPAATAPRRRRGRRVAAVALVVVVALAVVGGGGAALLTWLQTRPLGEVTGTTSATSRQLRTGHCIESLPEDGTLGRVAVVPCGQAHDAEVVGELDLGEGPWPGTDDVTARAAAWCEMDRAQVAAGQRPVVWTPSERGWAQGDRVALCLSWDGA